MRTPQPPASPWRSALRHGRSSNALNWENRHAIVTTMQVKDHSEIVHLLAELRLEHRDLDAAIEQLACAIGRDELQLTRLKKRKLLLKDHIARLESKLIPDLDA